jgi:hypothetical protein
LYWLNICYLDPVTVLVQHLEACPRQGLGHSDAAKRASDVVNLHVMALGIEAFGGIVAIALADGSSDGVLYDNYEAAVTHQHGNEQRFFYIRVPPRGLPVCDAESLLHSWRTLAAAGFRTDAGRQPIPRLTVEDHRKQMLRLGN